MNDPYEVAELLVRCSTVPLARVASVLGFGELEAFSQWFEDRGGQHPETARAEWEALAAAPAGGAEQEQAREQALVQVRRLLFSVLDRRDMAPMIRAMRSRRPMT